ncbi:hypothetical protein [Massilia consociata]|uniref:Transmembrane protein n=1 Tax=Massilia consociata TaxID=760117 RepID=A0ABV6FFF7_9BURK
MTAISTAPARQPADWLKLGAIVVTTFVVCWAAMIGYWHAVDHRPDTLDLALTLLLPLSLLLAFWAVHKTLAARAAVPAAGTSTPASSLPAAEIPAAPVLAVIATALRSPHGSSAQELAEAIAENEARADLDKELVDDNGFPVMTARCDDARDEALQDEIAEWLAARGVPVILRDEQWRALTLATGVASELASLATDFMPSEGKPPMLQLRVLLPDDWPLDVRRAATMWLGHTVGQYGWPEAAIATPEVTEQLPTPAAMLMQLVPAASTGTAPLVAIVISCASLIGQESVDRLAASASLFSSSGSRGQIPGEGAAGLLLTDLQQAQAHNSDFALLGPLSERRRDSAADDARRIDSALLLALAEQVGKAGKVELAEIGMVVADTAHRPNRALELMGLGAPAIPQVDAADDIIRIGLGSGSCGAVPFVTVLALGRHFARERNAPVLCVSNEDPYLRSVALVRPAA